MNTRMLITGTVLAVSALALYGCLGTTEPTSEPTVTESNTFKSMKWLEYKDSDFGVSLKYPSNWDPKEENEDILAFNVRSEMNAPTPYSIKIVRLDNEANKSAPEALNFGDNYSMSKIGVDDLVAIKLAEPPESYSHFYYVERFPYIYKFVYMNLGDDLDYVSNRSFYEMLNSFRFIPFTEEVTDEESTSEEEIVDTTVNVDTDEITAEEAIDEEIGMHFFTSGPYKFKALYPTSWYYSGDNIGGTDDILHRYNFSKEPEGESVMSLDIVDEEMPEGVTSDGREISKSNAGGKTIIYSKLNNQVYKLTTTKDLESIANDMIMSIEEDSE